MVGFIENEINERSQVIVQTHATSWPTERILQQVCQCSLDIAYRYFLPAYSWRTFFPIKHFAEATQHLRFQMPFLPGKCRCLFFLAVTRPLPSDGGLAEDYGAPEAGQLPSA